MLHAVDFQLPWSIWAAAALYLFFWFFKKIFPTVASPRAYDPGDYDDPDEDQDEDDFDDER